MGSIDYDVELQSSRSDIQHVNDSELLNNMGYKQELKKNFGLLSMTGFGFSVLACWVAMGGSLAQVMLNGGPASLVWGWVGCCALTLCVALCMADLSSAYPVAGGQYSWCLMLAKDTWWGRSVSYACGWIQLSGVVGMTSISWYLTALDILALANMDNPDFVSKNWTLALVAIGIGLLSTIICLYFNKILHYTTSVALYWSLGGLIITFVVILACAPKFASSSFVFTSTISGGWSNTGMAVILGVMQSAFGIVPIDSVAHVAEEIEDAPKQVPRAMIMSVLVSFVTAFAFIIALLFCIQDLDAVINTPTGFPLMEIYYQATNSKAGTTCLSVILIVAQQFTNVGLLTESSRSVYAFARDGAFPLMLNKYLMYISPTLDVPVYAMFLVVVIAIGLISILFGSSTAFFTVISISSTGLLASFFLCIFVYMIRGKHKLRGYYNLGKYAIFFQIPALLYIVFCFVFMFFPTTMPVDANNMNYDCVAFGIVAFLAIGSWFLGARKTYISEITIPVLDAVETQLCLDENDAKKANIGVDDDLRH